MFAQEYLLIDRLIGRTQVKIVSLLAEEHKTLNTYLSLNSEAAQSVISDINDRVNRMDAALLLLGQAKAEIEKIAEVKRNVHNRDHQ